MPTFTEVPIEAVQEYWNRRPCNIRHSPKTVGTKEYFDEVEARKYKVEPHIPAFADFDRWRGKRVLEIGCGIGTDTINFGRAGANVTAIELSAESMALAKLRAEVFGLADRIHFVQGNAEELSSIVPPGPYDLVYSFGVIHHTPHPERVIAEIKKVTAAGSTLKLMMYYKWSFKVFWINLIYGFGRFWNRAALVARYSEAQTGCPVTYTYGRRELTDLMQKYDFRTTGMTVDHVFPYRISDYKEYRYVKVWYFRWMPAWLFRRLEHLFGWHLCASAERV